MTRARACGNETILGMTPNLPEWLQTQLSDAELVACHEICMYYTVGKQSSCSDFALSYEDRSLVVGSGQQVVRIPLLEGEEPHLAREVIGRWGADKGWGDIGREWAVLEGVLLAVDIYVEAHCRQLSLAPPDPYAAFLDSLPEDALVAAAAELYGPLLNGERFNVHNEVPAYKSCVLFSADSPMARLSDITDPDVFEQLTDLERTDQLPWVSVSLGPRFVERLNLEHVSDRTRSFLRALTDTSSSEYLWYLELCAALPWQRERFASAYLDAVEHSTGLTARERETALALLDEWESTLGSLVAAAVALVNELG